MFSRFSKISPIALTYAYLAFCPQTLRAQENCGANRPQRFEFQKFEELLHELGPKPSPKRYEEMLQSFSDRCSFDGNYVNASNEEIPLIEHLAEHLFQNDNGLMNVIGRLCNRNDLTICLTLLNGQSRVTEYYRGRYKKKPADSDYKPDAAEMEQVEEIRGNFLLLYDKFDSDAALPARIAVLIFLAGLGDVDVSAKVEETGNRLAVLSQDQIKLSLLAFSGSDFDVVTGSSLTTLYSLIWKPLVEAYQRGSAIASANAVLFQQLPCI